MGRYIKWDDVVSRYKRYGDVVCAEESEEDFIVYAESYVESGLGKSFLLPLESSNVTVRDLCIDVAFAKVLRFKDSEKAGMMFSAVDSYISSLVKGDKVLLSTDGSVIHKVSGLAYSSDMEFSPVFGLGEIENFGVDPDRLSEEESKREF